MGESTAHSRAASCYRGGAIALAGEPKIDEPLNRAWARSIALDPTTKV